MPSICFDTAVCFIVLRVKRDLPSAYSLMQRSVARNGSIHILLARYTKHNNE